MYSYMIVYQVYEMHTLYSKIYLKSQVRSMKLGFSDILLSNCCSVVKSILQSNNFSKTMYTKIT